MSAGAHHFTFRDSDEASTSANPFNFPEASVSSPLFPSKSEPPSFIPIPGSASMSALQPKAGPSSEGALPRQSFDESNPMSPSSAPPVPSVIAVNHPSLYIHTHHPRRGSMTPLGLHVISPVPPSPSNPISPLRSVGFLPQGPGPLDPSYSVAVGRRGSTASTCSTLTSTRPVNAGSNVNANASSSTPSHTFYPPGFNRERRRSSLTPSLPTLAPPSPSRTHVSGRVGSRPTSSDGTVPPAMHARTRTSENAPKHISSHAGSPLAGNYGRRGSMPQLNYGGWNGHANRSWNPSLPTQRGSVEETTLPDEGFKFGSGPSAAAAALKKVDLSPSSRRESLVAAGKKKETDVFQEAEAEEAERQRRAFLAATYGQDGKRARERLSFAGPSLPSGSVSGPGTPGANLRRQSLMLWEKINTASAAARGMELQAEGGPLTAPQPTNNVIAPFSEADVGQRRGSLPLAIPNSGLGRSPSRLRKKDDIDAPPKIVKSEEESESEEEEGSDEEGEFAPSNPENNSLHAPQRPLPPLLPLSDPGPRLLPSTLALHRANHLLTSRNLQAEPLPHPLPPSLHPPAPVDLAEFDIDFILAGSRAQLGGEKTASNAPVDVIRGNRADGDVPPTPVLKLGGGDEEDSFAKFVGAFDDEYGGRRGEWSFRMCPPKPFPTSPTARDPFDTENRIPRSEWDCHGAGRFELFANGDVRSIQTGSVWRVRKSSIREFELEEIKHGQPVVTPPVLDQVSVKPTVIASGETYVLTSKALHAEHGGFKLPAAAAAAAAAAHRPSTITLAALPSPQLRVSISDNHTASGGRDTRLGSTDSAATAKGIASLSQSLPQAISSTPRKIRQLSRGERDLETNPALIPPPSLAERGRASISAAGKSYSNDIRRKDKRSESRDPDREEDKKKGGLGGAIKRAFKSTISANEEKKALREERERERLQSQSWSPSVARSGDYIHPSGRGIAAQQHAIDKGHSRTFPSASAAHDRLSEKAHSGSSRTNSDASGEIQPRPSNSSAHQLLAPASEDKIRHTHSPLSTSASEDTSIPKQEQGKAWMGVPDESVAMILPIEPGDQSSSSPPGSIPQPQQVGSSRSGADGPRQALLVWYVPFNSDGDDRPTTAASSNSSRMSSEPISSSSNAQAQAQALPHAHFNVPKPAETSLNSGSGALSTSMPKFQKLLRRRASKDKDVLKKENGGPSPVVPQSAGVPISGSGSGSGTSAGGVDHKLICALHPLPFRSFRIVARMVEIDDLRTESDQPSASPSLAAWRAALPSQSRTTSTSTSSNLSPINLQRSLPSSSNTDEPDSSSFSTAPTSAILQGRTFPTVIAVCHSRSQGVEFVLEGLDRLGFCQGESAWGPTGYEEWRGTGLSEKGRELLDILWAGCVGVMGLTGV